VIGEIALTVILMSGALLFGRSMMRLLAVDPGFRVEQLVTTNVVLARSRYATAESQADVFRRFIEDVRQVPGVESVGMVSRLPLDFGNSLGFDIAGRPLSAPGQMPTASYRQASTDYFRTMRIPVAAGRVFGAADVRGTPSVAVVNRALVATYFANQDPVGQGLLIGGDTMRVIGVVGDVPIGRLEDKVPPTVYLAFAQNPQTTMAVAIRTTSDRDALARSIRRALSAIDPSAALTPLTTMDDLITTSPSVFMRRFPLFVVGAFALTAMLLAIVGIYGVVSYSVAQRTREMGIRMALGAQPSSLRRVVMRQGGWMAAIGIGVGVSVALVIGRFAEKMLYGVRPTDPLTYVCVAALLAAVAVGATILPARRATRVDPALALRGD
jgi:predicted permease